jgi:uncharacterized protein YjiS (DUF1127 family)
MTFRIDTHSAFARPGGSRVGVARRLRELARAWRQRERQRREAARLGARDLADIGLTRDQLQVELSRPFWRR